MPQLGTADVTYTAIKSSHIAGPSNPMREQQFTMLFPNSTNVLYTGGGVPISNGQLGFPNALMKLIIEDAACSNGYVPKWDNVANTIRLYVQQTTAVTGSQLIEVTTAATVASTTLRVLAAGW